MYYVKIHQEDIEMLDACITLLEQIENEALPPELFEKAIITMRACLQTLKIALETQTNQINTQKYHYPTEI